MTTSRQPKGVPVGGQFAAATHSEPETSLRLGGPAGEQLAKARAALSDYTSGWHEEAEEIRHRETARRKRHARLAGLRSATMILDHFPDAHVLSYKRTPVMGITALDEIRDLNGSVLYGADDLDGPVSRHQQNEEASRREKIREAVRVLAGANLPPEHEAQGITVHPDHEVLHLPTALEDGSAFLEAEELTPSEASAKRVEAALAQWNDPDDAETRVRDLLTDLRHFAAANDIDLGQALDGSYEVFLQEHNDPAFKEGF